MTFIPRVNLFSTSLLLLRMESATGMRMVTLLLYLKRKLTQTRTRLLTVVMETTPVHCEETGYAHS